MANVDTSVTTTFQTAFGNVLIYGPYDTKILAYNDSDVPEGALFYLSGNIPGTDSNGVYIKITS